MAGDSGKRGTVLEKGMSFTSKVPSELQADKLKNITDNFSEQRVIRSSVFGKVYKGDLEGGTTIAVLRLDESLPMIQRDKFDTEVSNLMELKHDNILELIGFYRETKKDTVHHNGRYVVIEVMESFLCYEYLANGTLDKYLNDDDASTLNWDQRFKIIKGICQGLEFAHNPDRPHIHMNILPSSVWLDGNLMPKIADFGLSRIFGSQQTRINTINVIGRSGYMAPEYVYRGEISTQSDIYSLGMLIIEIITGEKMGSSSEDRSARNFVDKVQKEWSTDDKIISKYGSLDVSGRQQVKVCIKIGLKCVDVDRTKRPSIDDIVKRLDGKDIPVFNEDSTF